MTITERILARQSGRAEVKPGELVVADVGTCVLLDIHFTPHAGWRWPVMLNDPTKVVMVADHIAMSSTPENAIGLRTMRRVAEHYGIERCHFAGARQGISHQVIADEGYALPGTIVANSDSHTLSVGAVNCLGQGLGRAELLQILCTGKTWFKVPQTVRYDLEGDMPAGVTAKDLFLHIAEHWGAHDGASIEFGGPGQASVSLDARRTVSTMCTELSAEFAVWDPDSLLIETMRAKTTKPFETASADSDARYLDRRRIELGKLEPYVSGIDGVINNAKPLSEFQGTVRLDQCVVGSCANGTLEDLAAVAAVLRGHRVAPWVRFIVTPASQAVYREASRLGLLADISEAGALVTPSACGACAGQDFGALAPGEVCLTATTRNYKGRMGTPDARIYMASPATVAASAITGYLGNSAKARARETAA